MVNEQLFTSAFIRRLEQRTGRPWCGVLKYRDPDNPEQFKQRTKVFDRETVKTKSQAMQALEAWKQELLNTDTEQTLSEYMRRYIDTLEKTGAVEPSTVRGYRGTFKRISEGIKRKPLKDISSTDIQTLETDLTEAGYSSSTVGKVHRLIKQVYKHAVAVRDLSYNPCEAVKPPKRKSANPNALDKGGRSKALAMLEGMECTPATVAAYIAMFAGMRCGEICALRWRDIDLDRAVINVSQAIGTGEGGAYIKTPKNNSSRRAIPVSQRLIEVLTAWRGERLHTWESMRLSLGLSATPQLFSDQYAVGRLDGGFTSPNTISREWRTLARVYGLIGTEGKPCTFHDLRHTYATLAIAGGADVKSVSSNLGHANAAMTLNIYASADAEAKRRTADIVGRELEQIPAQVLQLDSKAM